MQDQLTEREKQRVVQQQELVGQKRSDVPLKSEMNEDNNRSVDDTDSPAKIINSSALNKG